MPDAQTRDLVIARHVRLAIDHTTLTEDAFADDVRRVYQQRTAEHLRRVDFHAITRGEDPYRTLRANAQLVRRMLDGQTIRMPVEIEEAVVLALPEPFRRRCLAELAGRYGLLAVEQPADTAPGCIAQMGQLAHQFGTCVQALAETIGDGHLSACDLPGAKVVVREIDELVARALALRAAHQELLDGAAPPAGPTRAKAKAEPCRFHFGPEVADQPGDRL